MVRVEQAEEDVLPLVPSQRSHHHVSPVGLTLELDALLALSKYLEASLTNDLILDIRGSRPWLRSDFSFCPAFQFSV
ncbi:MAG: hypothetical protein IPK13_13340 [Deltaproteobacteria bacterium]|nr:hypothetical protein [Deltaproteobacteria bacterium]